MKIRAKIKPNSKKGPLILKCQDEMGDFLEIFVREPATENKANVAVIKLLAQEFGVAKTQISLVSGAKSKLKIFKIRD